MTGAPASDPAATDRPPSALTVAAVVTYALLSSTCVVHWRLGGEYSGGLLVLSLVAAAITALVPLRRPVPTWAWAGTLLAVAVLHAWLLRWDKAVFYVPYRTPGNALAFGLYAWVAPALLLGCVGTSIACGRRRARVVAIGVTTAAVAASFGITALSFVDNHPVTDTLAFEDAASRAVLDGLNPYAIHMPNPFGGDTPFYPPDAVTHGPNSVVLRGYCYPPATLLAFVPAAALHVDVRFVFLLAVLAGAVLLLLVRPTPVGAALSVLLATCPFNLESINGGWVEPLSLLTFALTVWAAVRRPGWVPWTLGLFLASKQYTVFYLPAAVFLVPRPWSWRVAVVLLGKALLVVAVLTLPLALPNPQAYYHSTIEFLLTQGPRFDTLNVSAAVLGDWEAPLPGWVSYAAVVLTYAASYRLLRPGAAAFCLSAGLAGVLLFALNKVAFVNYYTVPLGMFLLAAAAEGAAVAGGPMRQDPSPPAPV